VEECGLVGGKHWYLVDAGIDDDVVRIKEVDLHEGAVGRSLPELIEQVLSE
jgi:hypothetical protein